MIRQGSIQCQTEWGVCKERLARELSEWWLKKKRRKRIIESGCQAILIVTLEANVCSRTLILRSCPCLFRKHDQEGTSREPHWVLSEDGTGVTVCMRASAKLVLVKEMNRNNHVYQQTVTWLSSKASTDRHAERVTAIRIYPEPDGVRLSTDAPLAGEYVKIGQKIISKLIIRLSILRTSCRAPVLRLDFVTRYLMLVRVRPISTCSGSVI